MIYYDSLVQWMDIPSQTVKIDSIAKMFGKYITEAYSDGDTLVVEFDTKRVLCTEWKGWSQVNRFIRRTGIIHWIRITTSTGKSIVCSPDQLIPVYDPATTSRGFHGETKYANRLTCFADVKPGDTLRVLHAFSPDGVMVHFDTVDSVTPMEPESAVITGYGIMTRYKFINCNDFYIWASDDKPSQCNRASTGCGEQSNCDNCHSGDRL